LGLRISILISGFVIAAVAWLYESPAQRQETLSGQATRSKATSSLSPEIQNANKRAITQILAIKDIPAQDIEHFGYAAIPILTELYQEAETNLDKSRIAWVFWKLGWKSAEIEKALMSDLDSSDANLKVWVQWGIAKSSDNSEVIEKLLYNMERDTSSFVRDKAACALASDFVHISPSQRVTILRGLIKGLSNDTQQVRASSIQALKVQTGQTKNYVASADIGSRARAINEWSEWLNDYERNL